MIVQRSLANGSMLAGGGVQFVVGSVLKGKQSIVGAGYGQEDLVELALSRALMACLGVLTKIWTAREQGRHTSTQAPACCGTVPVFAGTQIVTEPGWTLIRIFLLAGRAPPSSS